MKSSSGNRFTRTNRLLDAAAFNFVFAQASRSKDKLFTVLCRAGAGDSARLGLAISKKNCRKAVARNRLKRLIRESFRQNRLLLSGLDIVVINQRAAAEADNKSINDSLEKHWQRCSQARKQES